MPRLFPTIPLRSGSLRVGFCALMAVSLVRAETGATDQAQKTNESSTDEEDSPFEQDKYSQQSEPTNFHNDDAEASDPAPFSVGGVMTQVDENTWFKFYGFFQLRYLTGRHDSAEDGRVAGGGFTLRRTRLFFSGHLTNWMSALIRVGTKGDGSINLEQAYADFQWKRLNLRLGQWYLPVFQEQSLSPDSMLGIEFSAVSSAFTGGQTQGARLLYDLDRTRLQISASNGLGSGYTEVGSPNVANIALNFRAENVQGDDDYSRFNVGSAFPGETWTALAGFGLYYQSGGELRGDAVELGNINGDVTLKGHGLNLHLSASGILTENSDGRRSVQAGFVTQGGVFIFPWTELYGRYEAIFSEDRQADDSSLYTQFRGYTAGVNQYFFPERGLRLQADFVYYPDPEDGVLVPTDPNSGLFESVGSQWTIRTQCNVPF